VTANSLPSLLRKPHPKAPKEGDFTETSCDEDDFPSTTQFEAIWESRQQQVREPARVGDSDCSTSTYYHKGCELDDDSDSDTTASSKEERHLRRRKNVVEWHKEHIGLEQPLTLMHLTKLAEAQRYTGRLSEAARSYRTVCEYREDFLPDHPETWRVLADFAHLQMDRADTMDTVDSKEEVLREAMHMFRRALNGYQACKDEKPYWQAHNNYCLCLLKAGGVHNRQALLYMDKVLSGYASSFGSTSKYTLDVILNYAITLLKEDKIDDTERVLDYWWETYAVIDKNVKKGEKYGMGQWMRVSGSVYHEQGRIQEAHRCFARAFALTEHVNEARALLLFLRKHEMWTDIDPLLSRFPLLAFLRNHTKRNFSHHEMLKWYRTVSETAWFLCVTRSGKKEIMGASDRILLAEKYYRFALDGYQRLHNTIITSNFQSADRRGLIKVLEEQSMGVTQQLGDCYAHQAMVSTKSSGASKLLWEEAEKCWREVIFTSEALSHATVNSYQDPVYCSVYALSYRLEMRNQVEDAKDLFYRFIIKPTLERKDNFRYDSLQQAGDFIRAADLFAPDDFDVINDCLRVIIRINGDSEGDIQENCITVRALLLITLINITLHIDENEASDLTQLLLDESDLWSLCAADVVSEQVMMTVCDTALLRPSDMKGNESAEWHHNRHAASVPWLAETQNNDVLLHMAGQLDMLGDEDIGTMDDAREKVKRWEESTHTVGETEESSRVGSEEVGN